MPERVSTGRRPAPRRSGAFTARQTGRWVRLLLVNVVVLGVALEMGLRLGSLVSASLRRILYQREAWPGQDYRDVRSARDLTAAAWQGLGPYGDCDGFVLNRDGLRTTDYALARRPGTRRIVVLGDSCFVEAGGVRDADHVVTRLTAALGTRMPTEVLDLAATGTGPRFYRRMLEVEGVRLAPDAVVVGFFVGNDLTDEPVDAWTFTPAARLGARWWGFRLARNLVHLATYTPDPGMAFRQPWRPSWPRQAGAVRAYPFPGEPEPALTDAAWFAQQRDRSIVFDPAWLPELMAQWAAVRETLAGIAEVSAVAGARLLVVVIPDETQVNPALAARVCTARGGVPLDLDKPQRLLGAFLRERGVAALDLLPEFRARAAAGVSLYMPRDGHWNAAGQRLAAVRIAARLEALLAPGR